MNAVAPAKEFPPYALSICNAIKHNLGMKNNLGGWCEMTIGCR